MNNRNVDSCKKDVSDGNEDDDEDDGKNTFYKIPTRSRTRTTTQRERERKEQKHGKLLHTNQRMRCFCCLSFVKVRGAAADLCAGSAGISLVE